MYGSGRGTFSEVLSRTRTHVLNIRAEMNPGFGGIHPEPVARYLRDLVANVNNHHAHLGLATDGDADRIGAVDSLGNFVDPAPYYGPQPALSGGKTRLARCGG